MKYGNKSNSQGSCNPKLIQVTPGTWTTSKKK